MRLLTHEIFPENFHPFFQESDTKATERRRPVELKIERV
jgi:hypothetical protein